MRAGCSGDKAEATKARILSKVHALYAAGYRGRNIIFFAVSFHMCLATINKIKNMIIAYLRKL